VSLLGYEIWKKVDRPGRAIQASEHLQLPPLRQRLEQRRLGGLAGWVLEGEGFVFVLKVHG
jgi:hypothetical protein